MPPAFCACFTVSGGGNQRPNPLFHGGDFLLKGGCRNAQRPMPQDDELLHTV